MLGSKGAAGLKPCPLCQNVFLAKLCHGGQRRPLEAAPNWAVTHCEPCKGRLVPMNKATLMSIVGKLEESFAGSPSAADFAELQTSLGWTYDPELRARALKLRIWETPVFDWMHVLFVSGVPRECKRHRKVFSGGVVHQAYCLCSLQVFQKHTGLLIQAARSRKWPLSYDVLQSYLDQWGWPHAVMSRNGMKDFLSPKRTKSSLEAGTFKCTASEALSCMPVSSRLLPMIPNDLGK